jgi:hypothetical protein
MSVLGARYWLLSERVAGTQRRTFSVSRWKDMAPNRVSCCGIQSQCVTLSYCR